MAKPNAVMVIANKMARAIIAEQTRARVMLGFDAAIIAAHEVFHMGPGRSAAFANAYNDAMEDLATLYVDDAEKHGDKRIEYAKGKRDALIRSIVGDEVFVEFDRAYGEAYVDELKRIRLLNAAVKTEGER